MATLNRRPFVNRSVYQSSLISPLKTARTVSGTKRPRSPEPLADLSTAHLSSKRVKAVETADFPTKIHDKNKERKHAEREQQRAEFKDKYTRAFPSFTFYFEEGNIDPVAQDAYEDMIEQLGGRIVKFFDTDTTHFISNRPVPNTSSADKENNCPKPLSRGTLKSPIKLKGRLGEDTECKLGIDPLTTVLSLDKKIWNTAKLESVLTRLLDPASAPKLVHPVVSQKQPTLARLLKTEQIHGTTERDPTQKRHNFKYFTRGSKFVLVEDMRQELATIAAHEYSVPRARDGFVSKVPWPVLYCHPQTRGPFILYDDKERKRWEKLQNLEAQQEVERKECKTRVKQVEVMKRKAQAHLHARRVGDLRRSVSMNNLHRRATLPTTPDNECAFDEGDTLNSVNASGFLASGVAGYMAASGNSVGVTSTVGTTSTAGYTSRHTQLSSTLNGRMKQHIVTSRKFPSTVIDKDNENRATTMGPPAAIPEGHPKLRKSRSTNTLKLSKREEGSKPGYCESCRVKFEDFQTHIASRKHQRFATNDANFFQLDCVLARVQRRTIHETLEERVKREAAREYYCRRTLEEERDLSSHGLTIGGVQTSQQGVQKEDIKM